MRRIRFAWRGERRKGGDFLIFNFLGRGGGREGEGLTWQCNLESKKKGKG